MVVTLAHVCNLLIVVTAAIIGTPSALAMTYTALENSDGFTAFDATGETTLTEADEFKSAEQEAHARQVRLARQDRHIPPSDTVPYANTLFIRSPGGNVFGSTLLAKAARESDITVVVPANEICASACFNVFMAAKHHGWEPGARIGVHSTSNGDDHDETLTSMGLTGGVARILSEWGATPAIIGKTVITPPGEITWLTENDLRGLGENAASRSGRRE